MAKKKATEEVEGIFGFSVTEKVKRFFEFDIAWPDFLVPFLEPYSIHSPKKRSLFKPFLRIKGRIKSGPYEIVSK